MISNTQSIGGGRYVLILGEQAMEDLIFAVDLAYGEDDAPIFEQVGGAGRVVELQRALTFPRFAEGVTVRSVGSDCTEAGQRLVVEQDKAGRLYVPCVEGKHYLHPDCAEDYRIVGGVAGG